MIKNRGFHNSAITLYLVSAVPGSIGNSLSAGAFDLPLTNSKLVTLKKIQESSGFLLKYMNHEAGFENGQIH